MRSRNPLSSHFVGVLGWPLGVSLSPVIHNAAFRHLGMDWIYLAFPVEPEALPDAVAGLRALGGLGANVTMPHKEAVVHLVDEVSGDAEAVGAVNTIERFGDRLLGHNTDVEGFRKLVVTDAGVDPAGERALVLGAGGAARAVIKALDDLGAKEIVIAARDSARAAAVTAVARASRTTTAGWEEAPGIAAEADLVVNATPLGMNDEHALARARWSEAHVVIDLVYEPPATRLVEAARLQGAQAWGGVGMLVHQAAASFRLWTGQEAPLETMSAAALHALAQRHPDSPPAGSTGLRRLPKDD